MADPVSALLNVISLIGVAIRLQRELRRVILSYRNAEKDSKNLELFGLNLNAHRLNQINRFIEEQLHRTTLYPQAVKDLSDAVEELNGKLEICTEYFAKNAPNDSTNRARWALRAQGKLVKLQEDVQKHLDVISDFVLLVCTTSSELNKPPQPLEQPYFQLIKRRVLDGFPKTSATWADAHYNPKDAKFMREYNPDVHVLSEKVPKRSRHSRNGYKDEKQIATDLRKISTASSYARYHNGILPCIGYTPSRHLVSLFPSNMNLKWRPRSLQRAIVDTNDNDPTGIVTLEMRFSIALQLARALRDIHSAGFSNCSIRSDEILFVLAQPDELEELEEPEEPEEPELHVAQGGANNTVRQAAGPSAPDTQTAPAKRGVLRRFSFKRTKTSKEPGGQANGSVIRRVSTKVGQAFESTRNKPKKEEAEKDTTTTKANTNGTLNRERTLSMRSMRNPPDRTRNGENKHAAPPKPPASLLAVPLGTIPPGASVFLARWQDMCDYDAGPKEMDVEWYKDVYRHPKQQGHTTTRFTTGHDVYALGVCLLEIGLWDALVWWQDGDDSTGSRCVSRVLARQLRLDRMEDVPKALGDKLRERKGPQEVRSALVQIAARELPKVMGKGYTRVVQACLECMDGDWQKYWNVGMYKPVWGEGEADQRVKVCDELDVVLLSMLSSLSAGISFEQED